MPSANLLSVRGPWTGGYRSSVPPFMAAPDQLVSAGLTADTNTSVDCVIDPFTGGVSRRNGCAILNDTLTGSVPSKLEAAGLLNLSYVSRCRKLFAVDSPSLTNGYPTLCGLFGTDDNSGFGVSGDSGYKATLWLNSTNSAASTNAIKNHSLLEEFTYDTNYSKTPNTKATAADYVMKVVPMFVDSGLGLYNRGAPTGTAATDKFNQQSLCAGARNVLQTQNWMYSFGLRHNPWRWNKRFQDVAATGATGEVVRVYPAGPWGPLFPPNATTPSSSTSNASWLDGDTYFLSVIFQFEDGSYSAPFLPRAANDILTGGNGMVTVGTITGTAKYRYVTYSNIALGPQGTVARILCRTPKQTRTATTDAITVSPLDLRIIGVLKNNTQTDYVDYAGRDDSLLDDPDVIRFDYVLPRRSRYVGTGDQRVLLSYTLPNTSAIMLAPTGVSALRANNVVDTSSTSYAVNASYMRITTTDLELHYSGGGAASYITATTSNSPYAPGAGENAVKFPFSTFTSLEVLVDAINATTTSSACKAWACQLAPGIDGTMPTANLAPTTQSLACTTAGTTTLTFTSGADALKVPVGAEVSGTNVTAGTYVLWTSYSGGVGTCVLSASATLNAASTARNFYSNTGDEGFVTGATGFVRSFSPTWPCLAYMQTSAFPDTTADTTSVYFTGSSPGAASNGISLAPNSWLSGNRRLPHVSPRARHARTCVGIVDIESSALIAYSDGIYVLANQRGANTGEDEDYRLFTVNDTRGCISYLGLTSGNGWAAYPTTEGIVITDKNRREFVISSDIYNSSDGTGDLAYEIGQSAASVAADTDDQHFSMGVMGSKLVALIRGSDSANARALAYDFSPGVEASGVEELLNPDTKRAYIWNPPAIFNNIVSTGLLVTPGAIGSIRNASGRLDYISYDSNAGTGTGRVDRINTGSLDNSSDSADAYQGKAIPAPWVASDFMCLSAQRLEVTHRSLASTGTAIVAFAVDQTPTFDTTTRYRTLRRQGTDYGANTQAKPLFIKQTVPIDQGQRGLTDMFWAEWVSTTVPITGSADRVYRMVLQYDESEHSA